MTHPAAAVPQRIADLADRLDAGAAPLAARYGVSPVELEEIALLVYRFGAVPAEWLNEAQRCVARALCGAMDEAMAAGAVSRVDCLAALKVLVELWGRRSEQSMMDL